jgi:hypothetical protein
MINISSPPRLRYRDYSAGPQGYSGGRELRPRAITAWSVPRALPLAGPGQSPGRASFPRSGLASFPRAGNGHEVSPGHWGYGHFRTDIRFDAAVSNPGTSARPALPDSPHFVCISSDNRAYRKAGAGACTQGPPSIYLAGCEFQASQKCLRLINVYAINFMP